MSLEVLKVIVGEARRVCSGRICIAGGRLVQSLIIFFQKGVDARLDVLRRQGTEVT